jgi:hypothetical protein
MTALAIVGLVLFALVLGLMMLVAFVQPTVRDFRALKRTTVRVRFSRHRDTDLVLDSLNGVEDQLQLPAEKKPRERLDPDVPSGWGFDR